MSSFDLIRQLSFITILFSMIALENFSPRRSLRENKLRHDARNIGMLVISTLLTRLLMPLMPVTLALWCQKHGIGLLNQTTLHSGLELTIAFLFFDFLIYCQHVVFHRVPILWRLHQVHHLDLDYTATTGIRFHPAEILLSMCIKLAGITVIGPSIPALLAFEIVLNGAALFNHSNFSLPPVLEKIISHILVTPDMHRIHHSVNPRELNMNFGFNSPWWDKLLGTYQKTPELGQDDMQIGIRAFQDPESLTLKNLLLAPVKKPRTH